MVCDFKKQESAYIPSLFIMKDFSRDFSVRIYYWIEI